MTEVLTQILAGLNRMSERLDRHMEEEEGEISALMQTIDNHREESDRRHTALIQSINSYMEKQCDIERAFLLVDGQRDYAGHHEDHKVRKAWDEWKKDIKNRVLVKIAEWLGVALVIWLGATMWQAFLKGPT